MEQILAIILNSPLLCILFFGLYHSTHYQDPCAYHLRNAYNKIEYIHTFGEKDIWEDRGLYHTLKRHLKTLDFKFEIQCPNYQEHYKTIYMSYSKHMVNLFVSQSLKFESSHAKLSNFDYYIYTFAQYLRKFMWKEKLENIYLWDGEYFNSGKYTVYHIFEKDGKYQLSEFGLAYYKTLYMVEYYLQHQDERICKKKKCIRSVMKLGDYTEELNTIEKILETKAIEKKWISSL